MRKTFAFLLIALAPAAQAQLPFTITSSTTGAVVVVGKAPLWFLASPSPNNSFPLVPVKP